LDRSGVFAERQINPCGGNNDFLQGIYLWFVFLCGCYQRKDKKEK
jgi:hypothetical protein